MDIDVSAAAEIDFQINVTTSVDAGSSSLTEILYIEVAQSFLTPTVNASIISDFEVQVDSQDLYMIELFTCSDGCPVSNYILTRDTSL